MIAARVVAALGDAVAVVIADAGRTTSAVIAELRGYAADARGSVLLFLAADLPALDRAMLRAAIGPLAIDMAPRTRLNTLDIVTGAADDDIIAAAQFLAGATSTTGQLLEIR